MLFGMRHVPERLCGGIVYLGRYKNVHLYLFLQEHFPIKVVQFLSVE